MTFKLADRVQETTATSGTGSLALHGAVAGFQSFAATLNVGDTTYYAISDPVALTWEIGLGTFATGNTLTRTTVLASSHGGAKIALAGNAGTQVWQDVPASVLAALIAAQGTVASVTDGVTTVTNAATIDFTSGATVSNVGGVAAVAISAGSPLEVLGGGGTVTNATTINFTSGGTVSSGGTGVANVAISGGGGGGSYVGGIGIGIVTNSGTGTINNTGDLVLPGGTGTLVRGSGIELATGNVYGVNTAASYVYAGGVAITGGSAIGSTLGGAAYGGSVQIQAGGVHIYGDYTNRGNGAQITAHRGQVDPGSISGGGVEMYAGNGVASGGTMIFRAGNAGTAGTAGNVVFQPGTGATNGVLLVNNIGTVDPHILNAKWQTSVAGVGFVGVYSKG